MLAFILALVFGQSSHAILTEPTYHAAEALGYLVVGEVEFKRGSFAARDPQLREQVREIGELCPRTLARTQGVSSFVKLVLLAWSDSEFPSRKRFAHSAEQQMLAARRAEAVAEKLRMYVHGPLAFELVNMTTRRPHPIRVTESARVKQETYDVKAALEIAGGAPSDAYGLGLFGENGQRSKVIIWVDCKETFGPRRRNVLANVQLASLGANFFSRTGN